MMKSKEKYFIKVWISYWVNKSKSIRYIDETKRENEFVDENQRNSVCSNY